MKIAFFRGNTFIGKVIRLWTRSQYSHTEILLCDYQDGTYDCLSADYIDGVRINRLSISLDEWDIVDIDFPISKVYEWYSSNYGKGYDYLGLLGFVISPLKQTKSRWFCSEIPADILGFKLSSRISPSLLYSIITSDLFNDLQRSNKNIK